MTNSSKVLTTVDWYEDQKDSFRKELDDTIIVHKFYENKVDPDGQVYNDTDKLAEMYIVMKTLLVN